MTLRIGVLGATGRMGRRVIALASEADDLQVMAAVAHEGSEAEGVDAGLLAGVGPIGVAVHPPTEGVFADCDVVIDFSLPEGTLQALPLLGGAALVSGVTGLSAEGEAQVQARAEQAPVLVAGNFSTGANVLAHLVEAAARALPAHDIEVVEAHHRRKADAPSGTALLLGRAAAKGRGLDHDAAAIHGREGHTGLRPSDQIGYHAIRGGDVVGDHTVWLAGEGDRLLLGHVATSRDTFAHGALRAARWLHGKAPGMYTMAQVLGL